MAATPTGANYATAVPRSVEIRLVPPGSIVDPSTGPVARFTTPSTTLGAGQPIVFDATTSSSPSGLASYAWDFGDGTTGSGATVQHSYAVGGTYYVRLTVTDQKGQTAWATNPVVVAGGPTALFAWVQQTVPTFQVVFDGSASWAVPPSTLANWEWNFGTAACPSVTGPPPTPATACNYPAAGKYQVTLKVTDSKKLTATTTQTIEVK